MAGLALSVTLGVITVTSSEYGGGCHGGTRGNNENKIADIIFVEDDYLDFVSDIPSPISLSSVSTIIHSAMDGKADL